MLNFDDFQIGDHVAWTTFDGSPLCGFITGIYRGFYGHVSVRTPNGICTLSRHDAEQRQFRKASYDDVMTMSNNFAHPSWLSVEV